MRDAPSAELTKLLARLQLATPQQVRAMRRYAQSLARDLPLFDSVWVDALMRRRVLTPYQAAEINAGRGSELALGPVVLFHPPERLGYADQHLARIRETGEQVRVVVARLTNPPPVTIDSDQLTTIAEQLQRAQQAEIARGVAPILQSGRFENRVWIVQPFQNELSLREWLLRGGRLPAEHVLEIARQMATELAGLEQFSLVHGDISSATVRIQNSGLVSLTCIGLRSVVRPGEGYSHSDLSADAYNYLAPERIAAGTAANIQSDLYACGCLWWQLLTGRPPLAGGDSLAKIKAAHAARIIPLARFAPEAPALLISVIHRLLQATPASRGASFSELAQELGPSSPIAQRLLADSYRKLYPWTANSQAKKESPQRSPQELLLPEFPSLQSWLNKVWNAPWLSGRGAAISAALSCFVILTLAAWFLWPIARSLRTDAVAQHPGSAATPPGILGNPNGHEKPIATAQGIQEHQPLHDVRVVSHTADEQEQEAIAEHAALAKSTASENPNQSMKVVRQVLPIHEIVLPSDRVVQASTLELHPGMRLAPAAGTRARVQVPVGGWHIDADEVRLENIDFILPASPEEESEGPTFVVLKSTSAQFHGCAFRADENQASPAGHPVAICWMGAEHAESIDRLPAAGHLLLANCFLANLHTGVDCRLAGPIALELDNVLFTAPREAASSGSLWRMDHAPASEDTFVLRMNACTVRDAMSLVDVYCSDIPAEPGKINLETIDCVFSLRTTGALLRMVGPYRPDRLVRSITWGGRGSLLPIQGRVGLWYDAQGSPHAIDDTGIDIDGLVRGGVEFAGEDGLQPHDSVLTHWAAPLIGDARPGVRVSALPGGVRN